MPCLTPKSYLGILNINRISIIILKANREALFAIANNINYQFVFSAIAHLLLDLLLTKPKSANFEGTLIGSIVARGQLFFFFLFGRPSRLGFGESTTAQSAHFRNYYHHYHIYWLCAPLQRGANAFDLALINNHYCAGRRGARPRIVPRIPEGAGGFPRERK